MRRISPRSRSPASTRFRSPTITRSTSSTRPCSTCLRGSAKPASSTPVQASESFEVTVHFPQRDGVEFPVIEVPTGIRTPVAAKSDLVDSQRQSLIRRDTVFVRSLDSSGVASTTAAGWKDWSRLGETCFDNREADTGRFLRGHLSGVGGSGLKELLTVLTEQAGPAAPTLTDRLRTVLDLGLQRFHSVAEQRKAQLPQHGWWETSVVVR